MGNFQGGSLFLTHSVHYFHFYFNLLSRVLKGRFQEQMGLQGRLSSPQDILGKQCPCYMQVRMRQTCVPRYTNQVQVRLMQGSELPSSTDFQYFILKFGKNTGFRQGFRQNTDFQSSRLRVVLLYLLKNTDFLIKILISSLQNTEMFC